MLLIKRGSAALGHSPVLKGSSHVHFGCNYEMAGVVGRFCDIPDSKQKNMAFMWEWCFVPG